ncbi:MAG: histidine kinase [Cyclobacteriaceae bacterium]|nr:histidine kinase [Cyclobacteriaceae bacterium]
MIKWLFIIQTWVVDMFNSVPRNWKNAYFLICLWYFINYAVSAFFQWKLFKAYDDDVFWNTLYLYEVLCIAIIIIFVWSRWLFQYSKIVQLGGHFAGLFFFTLIMESFFYYFDLYLDGLTEFDDWQQYMIDLLSWDAMRFYDQYIITVGVFYIIRYFETLQKKENEKSVLMIKNKEMQLSLLKSQINPHFLFNTLNSISMLISTSKDKARKVISQLSEVFRYALDSYRGYTVKLSQEIEFIDNYIKIQQVRFEDRLIFEKDIATSCLDLDIPPMILQPLVENAVKYGIAPKDEGGTIKLTVRPHKKGIFFEVKDNGLGVNAKMVLDASTSSGIGLDNTNKRLISFFGPTARLMINSGEDGYVVSFTVPERYKKNSKDIAELTYQME